MLDTAQAQRRQLLGCLTEATFVVIGYDDVGTLHQCATGGGRSYAGAGRGRDDDHLTG
ncbi:hypothetical protein I552_3027 [Mycobacterium xenopi 3993]|nr:hypothetical protein I552_3027 [Mycobacterium xenopi 3993]